VRRHAGCKLGDGRVPLGEEVRRGGGGHVVQPGVAALGPVLHAGVDGEPAGLVEGFVVVVVQQAGLAPGVQLVGQGLGQGMPVMCCQKALSRRSLRQ
jgi:hypothetical protein